MKLDRIIVTQVGFCAISPWSRGVARIFEGGSTAVLSYQKQGSGSGGPAPQPLRDFQYFNELKLSKLLYFMQKIQHINFNAYRLSAPGMKLVLDKAT